MSFTPDWDKETPILEWLQTLCFEIRHLSAIRSLGKLATTEELEQRYKDPELWVELAERWKRAHPNSAPKTAREYLSRARVGVGISSGRDSAL